jgi:hypothetical protein
MEDSYGERGDEVGITGGEDDYSEQDVGNIAVRKRRIHIEGTKEKEAREKRTADKRVSDMEKAVTKFRIASSGAGLLRGSFGRLPTDAQNLMERMQNLSNAMSNFKLEGDDLNVSGSFDKGYTVSRENPCEQEQVNQEPT